MNMSWVFVYCQSGPVDSCRCFCLQSRKSDRARINVDDLESVCVHVRLSVRLFLASDSSETVEVSICKLGTVTASDLMMHHVLIILTLTFIQGHIYLNHENNKMSDYFSKQSPSRLL